jgi:RNA polymerase sigma-70 factor (ECF subfamily)
MLLALDGDSAAYRTLLQELARLLKPFFTRRLFVAAEAEDLVQETLLAIHTRRITYDQEKALLPWVHGIAHHKLIDHLRRHGRQAYSPLDEDFPTPDETDATDARLDLDRMLDHVTSRTAHLIRKVRIDGQSIDDAARDAGSSPGAVKVAIHRGLTALAQQFRTRK